MATSKPMTNIPPPERIKKAQSAKKLGLRNKAKRVKLAQKKQRDKKHEMIKRYYKYRNYFKSQVKRRNNFRGMAKIHGNYYVEPEPKIAFVVRIRGINDMPPKPKKILQLLRLRQITNGVFVRLNKATLNMLRLVSPWIAWGYPSLVMIRRLMYKRGMLKIKGQRKRITNERIEKQLHKYNIICMEDLIFQIAACGKRFKDVNRFLWPFKLRSPKGGFRAIRKHYVEGGDFGNREHMMDLLLRRMI
jgi:60S ribosomal protein uL30